MADLELLIRPYQAPTTILSRRIVPDGEKLEEEEAVAEWGQAGELPAAEREEELPEDGVNFNVVDCDDKFTENKRAVTPIRIEQQDNPDNFIVFEQINKIAFEKKEKKDGGQTYDKTSQAYSPQPYVLPDGSSSSFPPSGLELGSSTDNKCASEYTLKNPAPR